MQNESIDHNLLEGTMPQDCHSESFKNSFGVSPEANLRDNSYINGVNVFGVEVHNSFDLHSEEPAISGTSTTKLRKMSDVEYGSLSAQKQTVSSPLNCNSSVKSSAQDYLKHASLSQMFDVQHGLDQTETLLRDTSENARISSIQRGHLSSIQAYLFLVPHLCTLTAEQLSSLKLTVQQYSALEVIISPGQLITHAYVVASGSVEIFNLSEKSGTTKLSRRAKCTQRGPAYGHRRIASVTSPNLLCSENLVLDIPATYMMSAGSAKTTILLIPKDSFLSLIQQNSTFRSSVGQLLTSFVEAFSSFKEMCVSIFTYQRISGQPIKLMADSDGYALPFRTILACYSNLDTRFFHLLRDSPALDTAAWRRALARLPENITDTFVLSLTRGLPPFIASRLRAAVRGFEDICCSKKCIEEAQQSTDQYVNVVSSLTTKAFNRPAWRLGDRGSTLVFLREGFTDILDIVARLCVHIVESRKLRLRLTSMVNPSAFDVLCAAEHHKDPDTWALQNLPLSNEEALELRRIWPGQSRCVREIMNILMQREELVVKVDTSMTGRFGLDPFVQLGLQIKETLLRSLGLSCDDELPEDLIVDVLFGNIQATRNLFCCTFAQRHAAMLQDWMKRQKINETPSSEWSDEDAAYWTCWKWLNVSNKTSTDSNLLWTEYNDYILNGGFYIVEKTAMTGLLVDVIDLSRLTDIDPVLRDTYQVYKQASGIPKKHYLISMQNVFGAQADGIARSLILLFGMRLRSLNVAGKVVGVEGRCGDVLIPNSIVFCKTVLAEDAVDEQRVVNKNIEKICTRMRELLSPRYNVLSGSTVTVPSPLIIDEEVNSYYRTIYNAGGFEFEGSYFARQLEECKNLGLSRPDAKLRLAYYLGGPSLKQRFSSTQQVIEPVSIDCVPPLYAITRSILERLLTASIK